MKSEPRHLMLRDLDGTLLDPQGAVSPAVWRALERVGARHVIRVVATGRSLLSTRRVLPQSAPIDYVAVSSGAGICRWPDGELLCARMMPQDAVCQATSFFTEHRIDFMVHDPVPNSHGFAYAAFDEDGCIWRRISAYREHCRPLPVEGGRAQWVGEATQVVAMLERSRPEHVHRWVEAALPNQRVVRTTSPWDGRSLWIEVFPKDVSKAKAGAWLAAKLRVSHAETFAVGNDYNDECMLAWAATSRVVQNAPADLRQRFGHVRGHADDGVADALRSFGLLDRDWPSYGVPSWRRNGLGRR